MFQELVFQIHSPKGETSVHVIPEIPIFLLNQYNSYLFSFTIQVLAQNSLILNIIAYLEIPGESETMKRIQ